MFVLLIVSLAALVTVTTAQCSGNLTNTSFVLSWSANNTYVRFTMSAPSNGDQYIGVGFFNSSRLNISSTVADFIFAGDNGQGQSFVEDRWFVFGTPPVYDTQQNLTQTSTSFSNGILTASFTRPIVSSDKDQDVDLNICRFVGWTYGGNVTNFTSPFAIGSRPMHIGVFNIQICLPNNCQASGTANLITSPTIFLILALVFILSSL